MPIWSFLVRTPLLTSFSIYSPFIYKSWYKAFVSDPAIGENLEIGGFTGTGDFTIKIPRASFDKRLPKLGEIIEFEGERFRITRITNHPQYPLIVLVVGPLE